MVVDFYLFAVCLIEMAQYHFFFPDINAETLSIVQYHDSSCRMFLKNLEGLILFLAEFHLKCTGKKYKTMTQIQLSCIKSSESVKKKLLNHFYCKYK